MESTPKMPSTILLLLSGLDVELSCKLEWPMDGSDLKRNIRKQRSIVASSRHHQHRRAHHLVQVLTLDSAAWHIFFFLFVSSPLQCRRPALFLPLTPSPPHKIIISIHCTSSSSPGLARAKFKDLCSMVVARLS